MVIFRSLQPEAAPTESFTEPEAIMLENINEFNNQLSHWRQRLTIPNTDQIQVIRDRLDQTVSMVCNFCTAKYVTLDCLTKRR